MPKQSEKNNTKKAIVADSPATKTAFPNTELRTDALGGFWAGAMILIDN